MKIILQKLIASSGHCSRRKAEEMIRKGQIKLNGIKAVPGDKADPDIDTVFINNKPLKKIPEKIYIRLNKPSGYTCTNRKFPGEKNIFSLVDIPQRLFTIGRLDKNSRGLVILTNDGSLNQLLSHPKYKHKKIYQVKPIGEIRHPKVFINKLKKGVDIGEGDGIVSIKKAIFQEDGTFLITLIEGKKRQLRRMFKAMHLEIRDLKRINFGKLGIGGLKEGKWSYLNNIEINKLKE